MLLPLAASIFYYIMTIAIIVVKIILYLALLVIIVLLFLLFSPLICLYIYIFRHNNLIKLKEEFAQVISDDKSEYINDCPICLVDFEDND